MLIDNIPNARFLDSFVEYFGVPVDTLSGLGHLEGEIVDVIADGTAHPQRQVSGGSITLNGSYSNIAVGLGYVSEVRPLLPEVKTDYGTSLGRMQRITNIDIDLYQSIGMFVGRVDDEDGESEEEIPFRDEADLTGTQIPPFTGILHLEYEEGFNRKAEYFIRQKQPLPLTVRAVIDTIEVYE